MEGEYSDWVGTVEHLQFQLYLESPCHFRNWAIHFVIEMLLSVGQAVTVVKQARTVVYVDRFDEA